MRISNEPVREEFSRDTHWTRIHFASDDGSKQTVLAVCASHEYLWDKFRTKNYTANQKNQWINEVIDKFIDKWRSRGDALFAKEVHYDVYATSNEGFENGMEFLTKEIEP